MKTPPFKLILSFEGTLSEKQKKRNLFNSFIDWSPSIPYYIEGSLCPTYVSVRLLGLSVRHAVSHCTITTFTTGWLTSIQISSNTFKNWKKTIKTSWRKVIKITHQATLRSLTLMQGGAEIFTFDLIIFVWIFYLKYHNLTLFLMEVLPSYKFIKVIILCSLPAKKNKHWMHFATILKATAPVKLPISHLSLYFLSIR